MASGKEMTQEEKIEKIKGFIKDSKNAMFTTISEDGIVSRPMATQETEFDGDLWFITFADTAKIREIELDPRVNVSYSDGNYVSLSGIAEVVNDPAKKKELWNKVYERIFETSYDDPNLVAVKVHAKSAEYWEAGSKVKMALQFVTKAVGNKEKDPNINETVTFDNE